MGIPWTGGILWVSWLPYVLHVGPINILGFPSGSKIDFPGMQLYIPHDFCRMSLHEAPKVINQISLINFWIPVGMPYLFTIINRRLSLTTHPINMYNLLILEHLICALNLLSL